MREKTVLVLIILVSLPLCAWSGTKIPVKATPYTEVEVTLDENFTLADAEALPKAPHSQIESDEDSTKVKLQVSDATAKQLLASGQVSGRRQSAKM